MTDTDQVHDRDENTSGAGPQLAWQEFVDTIRRVVPGLPQSLGRDFAIGGGAQLGKFQRAGIRRAIELLSSPAPAGLMESIDTLGEAYDWYRLREPVARSDTVASAIPTGPDQLVAAGVRLRPLTPEDLTRLYYASIDPRTSYRWRWRGSTPSLQHFVANAYEGVLAQFAVADAQTNECHGLVVAYNANPDAGHLYFAFQRANLDRISAGEMMTGSFLFFEYVFRTWPYRKIYLEMPEYNYRSFLSATGDLLHVEGILREHFHHNGKYHDMYVVAIYREAWRELADAYWELILHQT